MPCLSTPRALHERPECPAPLHCLIRWNSSRYCRPSAHARSCKCEHSAWSSTSSAYCEDSGAYSSIIFTDVGLVKRLSLYMDDCTVRAVLRATVLANLTACDVRAGYL